MRDAGTPRLLGSLPRFFALAHLSAGEVMEGGGTSLVRLSHQGSIPFPETPNRLWSHWPGQGQRPLLTGERLGTQVLCVSTFIVKGNE